MTAARDIWQCRRKRLRLAWIAFLSLLPGACGPGSPAAWPGPPPLTPTRAPQPPASAATPAVPALATDRTVFVESASAADDSTLTPPSAATTVYLWVDPAFPGRIELPPEISRTELLKDASLRVEIGADGAISPWVYALVAPFPNLTDSVSSEDLRRLWQGETSGPMAAVTLLVAPATSHALSRLWGAPAVGQFQVQPPEQLLQMAWDRPSAWAIIPFESVEPRWKVLAVDGQSPLHREFDPSRYPLVVPFSLAGPPHLVEVLTAADNATLDSPAWPLTNRDPDRLTILALSGVTALVRATAWMMELRGLTYPAQDIGQWLRQADITHISNEVPFAEDCPYPDPAQEGVVFCSNPKYIALLEDVGTDVVELTGDHFHDWGTEAMLYTLELYQQRGWLTYGGGRNYDQGIQPVFIEHNGNRLAFIGCNGKGGGFARAGATLPGSAACDRDWMRQQIADLAQQGYLVVATFQHAEYYTYIAPAAMRPDFRTMAEAGAVIVSGSQAHQPHGFEFWGGGLIHFGLGNLFFDQYDISEATRQGVIDRHVFYDGRYLGVELLTYRFEDYARARPMNTEERQALLTNLFAASDW